MLRDRPQEQDLAGFNDGLGGNWALYADYAVERSCVTAAKSKHNYSTSKRPIKEHVAPVPCLASVSLAASDLISTDFGPTSAHGAYQTLQEELSKLR